MRQSQSFSLIQSKPKPAAYCSFEAAAGTAGIRTFLPRCFWYGRRSLAGATGRAVAHPVGNDARNGAQPTARAGRRSGARACIQWKVELIASPAQVTTNRKPWSVSWGGAGLRLGSAPGAGHHLGSTLDRARNARCATGSSPARQPGFCPPCRANIAGRSAHRFHKTGAERALR